jgi:HD-GYP domain-containing protein (c-di-GMP phosphodiesterase class II)
MEQKRIGMSDIMLGEPLPWDAYDSNDRLLLAKGSIIHRESQVSMLIDRGLFVVMGEKKKVKSLNIKETPSALRIIRDAGIELSKTLLTLNSAPNASQRILEITKMLVFATEVNRDVALATILHNHEGSYTVRHCIDTAIVALLVARGMDKSAFEIQALMAAALTMNVSMLQSQEGLQNRTNGLNEREQEIVRQHPQESVRMLREAGIDDKNWLDCVLDHHENEDGSGYPNGKRGTEINANAKVLAVADRYCASISPRGYRKSLVPNAAIRDVLLEHRKDIDPALISRFVQEFGTYPTGTFVRLENGEIGIVTSKGAATTTPYVHSLVGPRGAPLIHPIRRDTALPLCAIRAVLDETQAAIRFQLHQIWGADAQV